MLTPSAAAAVAARVRRLADTLHDLKSRVRAAVATEAGKAVADAVRDILTAVLGGRSTPTGPTPTARSASRERWHAAPPDRRDRHDPWDDDFDIEFDTVDEADAEDVDDRPSPSAEESPRFRWPAVVGLIAAAARGWAARRLPGWVAVSIGVLAAAAGAATGPLAAAGHAALAAAVDLAPHLFPPQ